MVTTKKNAFVFDSSADLKNNQIKDVYVLPLNVVEKNSGKTYLDQVEIDQVTLEKKLIAGDDLSTSATTPKIALELLEKLSKEYENVWVLPIPEKLSPGQNNSLHNISLEFDNVKYISNHTVALMSKWEALELSKLKVVNEKEIMKIVDKYKMKLGANLIVPDLKYLIKGGRINKAKAFVAKLLKIIPVCSFDREGVSFRDKAININKIPTKCEEYFNMIIKNFNYKDIEHVGILKSNMADKKFNISEIEKVITSYFKPKIPKGIKIEYSQISSVIETHVGPNYLALIFVLK